MTGIQTIINHEGFSLRALQDDKGDAWFIARDVCNHLGIANYRDALASLDEDERGVVITDTLGGPQRMTTVSEPGFYKLAGRSRKPGAKMFDRWVRHEVLPAIRKDGMYVMGEEKVRAGEMSDDEFILEAMTRLQKKVARLAEEKALLTQENAALAPKAALVDAHGCGGLMKVHLFAGTLTGVNANKVKESLMGLGFLYKTGGKYHVYSQYRDKEFQEKRAYGAPKNAPMDIFVTDSGKQLLVRLYSEGKLIMKKGF